MHAVHFPSMEKITHSIGNFVAEAIYHRLLRRRQV